MSGQGGNAAIETAAALANALLKAKAKAPTPKLTGSDIRSIFEQTQNVRQARTKYFCKVAHDRARFESLESPLMKFLATQVMPRSSREFFFDRMYSPMFAAVKPTEPAG